MADSFMRYVAALTLFDGYFDVRPGKNYEVVIADLSREFLKKLALGLRRRGVSCSLLTAKRDKAWRLRIYGKETILTLRRLAHEELTNPSKILLAAAIDAEGSIVTQTSQPLRIRITVKEGEKADAIERALRRINIPYLKLRKCRKRGECNYLEFVISNKRNVGFLLSKIKLNHPDKVMKILSRLNS